MRSNDISRWVCVVALAILPTVAFAQGEGSGAISRQLPGRRELKGTLTRTNVSKSFSEQFIPGLYRMTYLSETTPTESPGDFRILIDPLQEPNGSAITSDGWNRYVLPGVRR
jgi:hypothetical protein